MILRATLAIVVLAFAVLAGAAVMVSAGEAVVITQFGAPVRVLTEPGLGWKLPAPLQATIPVDLRLRTSSTGLQDVGTRDGLRILLQAYVAWQVPPEPDAIGQFVRAVRNDPDEAARQLRSFVGSALQVTASSYDFAELVNTDPARLRLGDFEQRLKAQVAAQVLQTYGIQVQQVGLELLSLPDTSLTATVARMRSERETVAAERTAAGLRAAGEVRSNAERDGRITVAKARTEAAGIDAEARRQAAEIQGRAYAADPQLYLTLRSLDSLAQVVGGNTRLVLRTDAAPFSVLVQGAVPAPPSGVPPAMTPTQAAPRGAVAVPVAVAPARVEEKAASPALPSVVPAPGTAATGPATGPAATGPAADGSADETVTGVPAPPAAERPAGSSAP